MIRAVAYGGNEMYLSGYQQQVGLLESQLGQLQALDSKYSLSTAGVLANDHLMGMSGI